MRLPKVGNIVAFYSHRVGYVGPSFGTIVEIKDGDIFIESFNPDDKSQYVRNVTKIQPTIVKIMTKQEFVVYKLECESGI